MILAEARRNGRTNVSWRIQGHGQRYAFGGRELTIAQWANEPEAIALKLNANQIRARLLAGWSVGDALTTPRGQHGRRRTIGPRRPQKPRHREPGAPRVNLPRTPRRYVVPPVGETARVIWGPRDELVEARVLGERRETVVRITWFVGRSGREHHRFWLVPCEIAGERVLVAEERFPKEKP